MREILDMLRNEDVGSPIAEFFSSVYFSRKGSSTLSIIAPNETIATKIESLNTSVFGQIYPIQKANPLPRNILSLLMNGCHAWKQRQLLDWNCRITTFFPPICEFGHGLVISESKVRREIKIPSRNEPVIFYHKQRYYNRNNVPQASRQDEIKQILPLNHQLLTQVIPIQVNHRISKLKCPPVKSIHHGSALIYQPVQPRGSQLTGHPLPTEVLQTI